MGKEKKRRTHLVKPLRNSLHHTIEMLRQHLQTPRIQQQPALTTSLRTRGTPGLRVRELLVLA